jgi:ABC-type antimicrobial peptide transport system permease subunit
MPYTQVRLGSMTFELRTASDPVQVVGAVREAIRRIDPNLPVLKVSTQTEQMEQRFAQERVFAQAYALFGGLAVLIASIGLFGLMSYSVARRTNEIGIRMALGADRGSVVAMVMRESIVLVAAGVVIGAAAALGAGRFVASLLYNLAPTDPVTIFLSAATMVAVSLLAGYLPARTASRVDPMIALRDE